MMEDVVRPSAVLRALLPWYARDSRWVKPIGELGDQLVQSATDALRLRFPTRTPSDKSLSVIGRDRLIPRAPHEPADSYARRLVLWLDLWGLAGTPLGLCYAVQSFIFPGYPKVRLVTRNQLWYTLDEGASETLSPLEACTLECTKPLDLPASPYRWAPPMGHAKRAPFWFVKGDPGAWNWDGVTHPANASRWWDFWMFIYSPSYPFQEAYNSGITYNSNTCWGLAIDPGTILVLRELIALYGRAGSHCVSVLFPEDNSMYEPNALNADWPDGRWALESVDDGLGTAVATRSRKNRYLLGFP